MLFKATALALAAGASAHMCTFVPLQRGGVGPALAAGSALCANAGAGPCGSAPAGPAVAAYIVGETADIVMQKNLDHYKAPGGNFSVSLWDASGKQTFLAAVRDTTAPSLSTYKVKAVIPKSAAAGPYILQTVYYTGNAAAPPAFYQCSDVTVLTASATPAEIAAAHAAAGHGSGN